MADKSKIQWCDATINPCYGCSPVSPACDNCYAARMAHRLGKLTEGTVKDGRWTGKVNLFPERVEQALRWRKPRRVFVGSMTDLFHENVPDEFLDRIFAYMAVTPQHAFILLTKRPARMRDYVLGTIERGMTWREGVTGRLPSNVWLGVTAEDQQRADERIPILLDTPAAKRFVSIEPMLGPVDLWPMLIPHMNHGEDRDALSWVICGGESGPQARPLHPDWARSLRDQCQSAGVPFHFKQWGEFGPCGTKMSRPFDCPYWDDACAKREKAFDLSMCRVGKHVAGRLLDGVEWNEFPESRS